MTTIAEPIKKTDPLAAITLTALVVLLGAVAARATVGELSSDAFGLGGSADIGGPGATTTILLNFLCVVPALLVLIRRAIDPTYVLRWHISQVLMLAMTAWITLTAIWASNKFDALIGASTWWAATGVLWAAGQLCRSWTRLRPILGIAAGLLLIFGAQSLIYRFYEGPELQRYWETDPELIARRQAEPDSFTIRQMDRAVHNGTQQGFVRSPNTFAAISVLAAFVAVGFVGQRLLNQRRARAVLQGDRASDVASASRTVDYARPDLKQTVADPTNYVAAVVIGLPLLVVPAIILWTGSRTAGAAAVMAAIALAVAYAARDWLTARSRFAYGVGVVVVLLGVALVVGVGLKTGGLVHDSLTFRWNYWIASYRMVMAKPWLGVGWTNFGTTYLTYRQPVAAEEIKDPHNFFVHFATEAGIIGLTLAAAWIARLLWELTRPVAPKATTGQTQSWVGPALCIALLFWVLRMTILWPLTVTLPELSKTALFALLLLVGQLMCVVRTLKDPTADDQPAPFLVCATIVGLMAFLLHNNVDFAIFETGPLLVFSLIVGGLLGIRHPGVAGKSTHTLAAIGGLGVTFIALLAAAGLWAVPVMMAEAKADAAEDKGRAAAEARNTRPDFAASQMKAAVDLYREAMEASPVQNPAYPARATRFMVNVPPNDVLAMLTLAIIADPTDPQNYLQRARYTRMAGQSRENYLSDYAAFVSRNPNDATIRVEYAEALDAAGQHSLAVDQLKAALATNDAMHADEPRRLPADKVKAIQERVK